MGLADTFKLSIYGLTAFVGVVLGAAELGWIPFVSLPVTVIAYYFCEIRQRANPHKLSGMADNPALILSAVFLMAAAIEFLSSNPEGKLLSGIHLVVFLTWVVLLQTKNDYRYWLLMALGVLQIAVGSVLTNASWFGLCMVIYLFSAVWTLSVFTLYRAEKAILSTEPSVEATNSQGPENHRIDALHSLGEAFNDVRFEDGMRWVSLRLFGGVVATSSLGLFVGLVFYVLIPRVWVGTEFGISDEFLPSSVRPNAITGMTTEVRLGEMRPILESNDPVLRMRMFDNQTNLPVDPQKYSQKIGYEAPYFRGAILTVYEKGHWELDRAASYFWKWIPPSPKHPSIMKTVSTVRQEVHLERLGNNILFCLGEPVAMHDHEGDACANRQLTSGIPYRRPWFASLPGAVDYNAFSQLPSDVPSTGTSEIPFADQSLTAMKNTKHLEVCSSIPEELPRLKELALRIVERDALQRGQNPSNTEKAAALLHYLRHSGQFKYSLAAPTVDRSVDPIEDFLINRRAGHCEYFASALALMLRSVDIPCRLVAGFKGGEIGPDEYLHVEKRFAHVWVEAWLGNRKWTPLDATPEDAREQSLTEIGLKRNAWTLMSTQITGMWQSNILDISYDRQQNFFYAPVFKALTQAGTKLREFWNSPRSSLTNFALFMLNPRNWLTATGAFTLSILLGLLWLIRQNVIHFRMRWFSGRGRDPDSTHSRVEFYERFSRLMETRGHRRKLAQTQGEFVEEMADHLASNPNDAHVNEDLRPIADLFYEVRFGAGDITPGQKLELNALLNQLEAILKHSIKQ